MSAAPRAGRRPMTPNDPRHGSPAGYVAGCLEECCAEPRRRQTKARRLARLRGVPSMVSAEDATALVARWEVMGVTRSALLRAAGSHSDYFLTGRAVTTHTFQALARLTEDDLPDDVLVYSDLTRTRIESLMALGHPLVSIPVDIRGRWRTSSRVIASTARTVRAHYAATAMQPGSSVRTRTRALNQGHRPPLDWDDPGTLAWPLRATSPVTPVQQLGRDFVDEAVVLRLADGRPVPGATRAEKVAAVRRWVNRGGFENELCRIHGWNEGRYGRARQAAS